MSQHEGMPRPQGLEDSPLELESLRALTHKPFESYHALLVRLKEAPQFDRAVQHVEQLYAASLSEATFLTKGDWEMLATLWLYDLETIDHSVETYRIARQRIARPLHLEEHAVDIDLAQEFSDEGVNEEQFLRACLFHDIGKLAIPSEVLTNHLTDSECARILYENRDSLGEAMRPYTGIQAPDSPEALLQKLREAHIRPQALVPIRPMLASEKERSSVEESLQRLGLSLDDSLLSIMQTHDRYSQSILAEAGFAVEAELAGAHHRHQKEYSPTPHTITIGTLQVSVDLADIIHLADVTQAMKSWRYYKEPESAPAVLATLVEHTTHNMVDPFVTYLWVADEWYRLEQPPDPKDAPYLKAVRRFLDENKERYDVDLAAYRAKA